LLSHLKKLDIPLVPLPGNHDERNEFHRTFHTERPELDEYIGNDSQPAAPGPYNYVVDSFAVRIVCIDSVIPFRTEGTFTESSAVWLDAALSERPDQPTLVAIHHPPFQTGLWWMDVLGLDEYDRFRAVLEKHPQVQLVLCGHHHRPISSKIGGANVWVSPSTANQHGSDLDVSTTPRLSSEPSAFSVHIWKNGSFVSHTVPVNVTYTQLEDLGPGYPEFVHSLRQRFLDQ
jgi:3',5'-cyclic-AMP phosphodiesterase